MIAETDNIWYKTFLKKYKHLDEKKKKESTGEEYIKMKAEHRKKVAQKISDDNKEQ